MMVVIDDDYWPMDTVAGGGDRCVVTRYRTRQLLLQLQQLRLVASGSGR